MHKSKRQIWWAYLVLVTPCSLPLSLMRQDEVIIWEAVLPNGLERNKLACWMHMHKMDGLAVHLHQPEHS